LLNVSRITPSQSYGAGRSEILLYNRTFLQETQVKKIDFCRKTDEKIDPNRRYPPIVKYLIEIKLGQFCPLLTGKTG
jgi:hypothetical protein